MGALSPLIDAITNYIASNAAWNESIVHGSVTTDVTDYGEKATNNIYKFRKSRIF
jgi:hypothetical protein